MPPIDPHQLLKALSSLLTQNGGIKGPTETVRIHSLMNDATKLASKCVYINILRATDAQETLEKFIDVGGWDILNKWLEDSKDTENTPVLVEILKVYQQLPITVDLLKKNSAAKTIKQLRKSEDERLKVLSSEIVEKWMNKIRSKNENAESSDKSKKKKSSRDKEKTKDEKDRHEKDRQKHSSHKHHSSAKEERSETSRKESDMDTDSHLMDDIPTGTGIVTPGNGLKIHIKLERKDNSSDKSNANEPVKKRPTTVKTPNVKFRATGLEETPILPNIKKKPLTGDNKMQSKRPGTEQKPKEEPPEKKSRLHLTTTLPQQPSQTSPTLPSPTVSPAELHSRIKIIPAKPKPVHEIHESNSFINDITRMPERVAGSIRRKKRGSVNGTGPQPGKPTTPTSPISPTTALKSSLPSVPSFYKETLDTSDTKESSPPEQRSQSPTNETMETDESKSAQENHQQSSDTKSTNDVEMKDENNEIEDEEESEPTNGDGPKGLLTNGKKKRKRKLTVTWAEETRLRQYHYFEMDETERENVNRPKDFNALKKQESLMDKRALETARRMFNDNMQETMVWRRPPLIANLPPQAERGAQSTEKITQKEREGAVLQAIFFNKDMLPDGPSEPDLENVEPCDPKFIPLEDESTEGTEHSYTYDSHAPPVNPQHSQQPQFQLPPEVANMLASFQHQASQSQTPMDINNPVIANVQNLLQSLMEGGSDPQKTGEALEKLKHALQPLQNQGMLGPPMGVPMGQGGPQGVPPRGGGLLGNAPPGFNMGMGPMGPNFPPQGPVMGPGPGMGPGMGPPVQGQGPPPGPNDCDDWGENMVGGPPPMRGGRGRPGIPMRGGRMPGPQGPGDFGPYGPRPGGPMGPRGPGGPGGPPGRGSRGGGRGGRRGSERSVCRHFAAGGCRRGENCSFLHPGVNGPNL